MFEIVTVAKNDCILTNTNIARCENFCYIGPTYGYNAIMGAVLIGGIIEGCLGLLAKYWIKLIQPIVAMLKYVAPVCLLLILLFAVSETLGIIKV